MKKALNIFLLIGLIGCAAGPYKKTNKAYKKQAKQLARMIAQTPVQDSLDAPKAVSWVGTTNFGLRKPNFVVIHHTAQNSCEQTLKTFTLPKTQVSAHYVICEDGTVHHMLNDYLRAWHAGRGSWGQTTDVNSASIGIELDNDGFEEFKEPQMQSLLKLLSYLKTTHGIPPANFISHADIAPGRKNDPNVYFDWKRLATKGFGTWYADTTKLKLPSDFSTKQAFKIVGYQSTDSLAVAQTFRRKFLKIDHTKPMNEAEKKVLYALVKEVLK